MWYDTVDETLEALEDGELVDILKQRAAAAHAPHGASQVKAWRESLNALFPVLKSLDPSLLVVLEHALPGSDARPDVLFLGLGEDGSRRLVVVEQKQWERLSAGAANSVLLGDRQYDHPSSQAQGYAQYFECLDASLVDREPASVVTACAQLPFLKDTTALGDGDSPRAKEVNAALVEECPVFGCGEDAELVAFVQETLVEPPDQPFIDEFRARRRQPSHALKKRLGDIQNDGERPWRLVGEQLHVYNQQLLPALEGVKDMDGRRVLVVTGGPGSGKSVLALNTMLDAVRRHDLKAALVSPTAAQHHSAVGELELVETGDVRSRRRPTVFPLLRPGALRVETPERLIGRKKAPAELQSDQAWRSYCDAWRDQPELVKAWDERPEYDVLVVDEAHALVDPSKPRVSGSQANAWRDTWGPQLWHVAARARLTVFFMDADQGYRQVESTRPEDVERYLAGEPGLSLSRKDLGSSQFRLAGGAEFSAWLDWMLGLSDEMPPAPPASRRAALRELFAVEESAGEMRDRLRSLHDAGEPSRLLAGYVWPWASKQDPEAVDSDAISSRDQKMGIVPPRIPDLCFRWAVAGAEGQRDFNLATGPLADSETLFGVERTIPATVGYPLTVRGRDFDHVGVIWGQDLLWRSGAWIGDARRDYGSDIPALAKAARAERDRGERGPATDEFTRTLACAYRILLTRGMRTVRVWFTDEATGKHVRDAWESWLDG